MRRKDFIKLAAVLPLSGTMMKLNALNIWDRELPSSPKMPVLFLGHGSPMNAIEENTFVQGFRKTSESIEKPAAILVVSAHWETKGTKVTAMQQPKTIHDFGGFPQALYDIEYPAPGLPLLAEEVQKTAAPFTVEDDFQWGLDHGAWTVIRHMYPQADIPVVQLSLDYTKSPQQHYDLARQLSTLRNKGILVVGSGNMVHNLRKLNWQKINENFAWDWAGEANEKMKEFILKGDHQSLIEFNKWGKSFELSIPTPEHYLPLLYTLALSDSKDEISLFNDESVGGSVSMTSVRLDAV